MDKWNLIKKEIHRILEISIREKWSEEFTLNVIMAIVDSDYVGGGN